MSARIKMKIAIVFIICLTASSILFAQRADDMLSKEEMNKEFDYLIELVSEVNPHLPIYKQMMNYDVIEEMKKQRGDIDKVENWGEYYKFLSSILNKIPEGHTRILLNGSAYYKEIYPYLADSLAQLNAKKISRDYKAYMSYIDKELNKLISQYGGLRLTYIDGRFYNIHAFNNNRWRERIATGWELVKINGDNIEDFMKKNPFNYMDRNRWDVNNKMSYNVHPTLAHGCFSLDVYDKSIIRNDLTLTFRNSLNKEKSVKFATIDVKEQPYHSFVGFEKPKWKWIDNYSSLRNKVICFDSILYIKIISMDLDSLDLFKREISKYGNIPLKKVVIDVRNNGGGSDNVWFDILSVIIDKTLCRKGKVGVSDSDVYRHNEAISAYTVDSSFDDLQIYDDPILKKRYRLLSNGTDCIEIVPDSSSLRYKGQIYLLHNRGSFSSSTAFLTFALGEERVVAVGEHNGCLGGYGVSPFVFQLPYSKLAFVMHSTIHIPDNAKSVEDYFWNKTEVEVTTTPEWEVLMYLNKDFFTPEILKTKDPFFKKVMELK